MTEKTEYDMAGTQISGLLSFLTTTKGALLAAPIVLGAGIVLSLLASHPVGSETAGAAQPAKNAPATAQIAASASATANDKTVKPKAPEAATETPAPSSAPKKIADGSSGKSSFSATQKDEIGKIVKEYLLANPRILVEMSEKLQKIQQEEQNRQREQVLSSSKQSIFRSPVDFALGDDDADVTIVEYFDYNCGWCKRALNEVTKLTESDSKVRVVMKEFPIFGEHSEYAARAALASKPQGKYWDFHVALMKEQRVTKDNVMQIAERVGIDVAKLKQEMENPKYAEAIKETQQIATSLGIEGTPGFIIDSQINPGYVPYDRLKQLVADVRKTGCKFC